LRGRLTARWVEDDDGSVREADVEGGLKSVAAALDLLDCFVEDEELGVSQVARQLGVAKSTAHRLLTTLASRGLIEQSTRTGRYRLGLHLFELGHLALTRLDLRRESRTLLEELRQVSGWTVHLAIAQGADALFLERLPTLRGMQAMEEFRRRWPLHATSSGKAICAFDPEAAQARISAGFPVFTSHTVNSEVAFRSHLAVVRTRGYATSREELMYGLASVAAPVLDPQGVARAAISITGSMSELGDHPDRQARMVMAASARLTKLLQRKTPVVS
jgi:DNA-binding IclR family transcriptional regulator